MPTRPPPPGALFDNVPTVAVQPRRKTSDDYAPCVAVWPSGRTQRANVLHVRLDSVESARRKLAGGVVAWVAPGDVEAVQGNGTQ